MADYVENVPIIITDDAKNDGRDVFTILDPDSGGEATLSVALSPTGNAPATHWGAYSRLEEPTYNALRGSNQAFKQYIDTLAEQRGRIKMGSVVAFKQKLLMGTPGEDFYSFATLHGLKPLIVESA